MPSSFVCPVSFVVFSAVTTDGISAEQTRLLKVPRTFLKRGEVYVMSASYSVFGVSPALRNVQIQYVFSAG